MIILLLWNLTGISAALLLRCLSNFSDWKSLNINLALHFWKPPHISPLHSIYKMSTMRIFKIIDSIITAPHCMYSTSTEVRFGKGRLHPIDYPQTSHHSFGQRAWTCVHNGICLGCWRPCWHGLSALPVHAWIGESDQETYPAWPWTLWVQPTTFDILSTILNDIIGSIRWFKIIDSQQNIAAIKSTFAVSFVPTSITF